MTGLAGGTATGVRLRRLAASMADEPWYESDRIEAGKFGVAAKHHGDRDPNGFTVWSDGSAGGMVHGAFTNRESLGWTVAEVFERLFLAPERTLRALDGPFLVVAVADDRILIGTDKIGARQCYYTTDTGFTFATGLAPIVTALDDPAVDEQGVSDLLLMGHMWSDTTLLHGVRSLYPASVLEYRDGDVTVSRYWRPSFVPAEPTEHYFEGLVDAFRGAMDRLAATLSGEVGLWLSGGLDSRATMNELARIHGNGTFDSLRAYTYDANPAGGGNPALAKAVADVLDAPIEEVPLTPDRFAPVLEESVDAVDGMVRWSTFLNLSAVNNIQRAGGVIMEGLEGALVGHHLTRDHLTQYSSPVDSMYHSEASLPAERVEQLLTPELDPMASFRREARRSAADTVPETVVDAHFQNYYMRAAHASNQLPRRCVGTRIPYADGRFLAHVAQLPVSYRMGTVPFTNGDIPYGVVKAKVRMIRALNDHLARIRYERSGVRPTRPFPIHVAGFFASTALARFRSKVTYGGKSTPGEWYREHAELRERVNGLLDDACDRAVFDADAVREVQQAHLRRNGEEIDAIAGISTVECWLQRYLD